MSRRGNRLIGFYPVKEGVVYTTRIHSLLWQGGLPPFQLELLDTCKPTVFGDFVDLLNLARWQWGSWQIWRRSDGVMPGCWVWGLMSASGQLSKPKTNRTLPCSATSRATSSKK